MKAILTILKKDLTLGYPWIANPRGIAKDKKTRGAFIGQLCLLIFLVAPAAGFIYLAKDPVVWLLRSEYADMVLGMLQLIALVVTLFFSVVKIISALYFSNDFKIMQRLPFSERSVLAGRVLSLTFSSMLLSLLLPVFFSVWHGILTGKDALFYVNAVVGSTAIVLFITSFVTLLIVLLMRFINRIPNLRAAFQLIGMILVLAVSVGPNFLSAHLRRSFTGYDFESVPAMIRETADMVWARFIPVQYWMKSLFSESLDERLFFGAAILAAGILMTLVTVYLGAKPLAAGVRSAEVVATRRNVSKSVRIRGWNRKSKASAVAFREIGEIFKTPVYLFNIAGAGILIPLILAISVYASMAGQDVDLGVGVAMLRGFLSGLYLQPVIRRAVWLSAGFVIGMFLGMSGDSAKTSMSREGKRLWLVKTLPFSAVDQVNGRLLCSLLFGLLSTLPTMAVLAFFVRAEAADLLYGGIAILISIVFISTFGLFIDLNAANFNWQNPQHAVKNSRSVFIMTISMMAYFGLAGFGVFKLFEAEVLKLADLPNLIFGVLGIHALLAVLLYFACRRTLTKKLIRYEVG